MDDILKKFLVALFLGSAFSVSVSASSININYLNTELMKRNIGWVARDNNISRLSDAEIKRLLGSTDLPVGNGLFEDRKISNESLDWRNFNGVNWLGPVMNQGNCGSCVAFAAVATLEATYRINAGLIWLNPSFSPQQLFNCGGGSCDFGWQPGSAANTLRTKGIVDLACAPYESGSTGADLQCRKNYCEGQAARTYKITGSTTPSFTGGSASKVKEALKKGPLVTTLRVYEDFLVYSSGIYKSVSSKSVGGHAVSLVGFNDQERYWIVRNSWGDDWGEKGFIRVSYDDKSGIADSTWAYQTAPESNYVSIVSPVDHEYVSGSKNIQVETANATTSEIIISGESDKISIDACAGTMTKSCKSVVDTSTLKDGRYEVYANSGGVRSQVREFLVVNHLPESTLSFKGSRGVDLRKPQKERVEFDIDVKANPVIPQKVTFIVENENKQIVSKRVTDQVVEQMRLGFRTNTVPNGKYTIYYRAETPYQNQLISVDSNKEIITILN
jgi:C1A family cysteine protease